LLDCKGATLGREGWVGDLGMKRGRITASPATGLVNHVKVKDDNDNFHQPTETTGNAHLVEGSEGTYT